MFRQPVLITLARTSSARVHLPMAHTTHGAIPPLTPMKGLPLSLAFPHSGARSFHRPLISLKERKPPPPSFQGARPSEPVDIRPPTEDTKRERDTSKLWSRIRPLVTAWKWRFILKLIIALVGVILGSIVAIVRFYRDWNLDRRVINSFLVPSKDESRVVTEGLIGRPDVEEAIKEIFSNPLQYGLIWGENGLGKTSSVVKVIQGDLRPDIPVLYMSATSEGFKRKLAEAIGFDLETVHPRIVLDWILVKRRPVPETTFLLNTLRLAAMELKKKSGHRPVLIIDACNELEKTAEGAKFLLELQDWAKIEADSRGMNVVFVSSEGKAPRTLLGRGVSSRMSSFHVPEATDNEARQFLKQIMGVQDRKEQDRILKIAGGSFKYLSKVDTKSVTSDISNNLNQLGLGMEDATFVSVSRTIMEKGSISESDFMTTFGGRVKGNKILEGNVFFRELGKVRFQNRATHNYMAKKLAEEEAKRLAEEEAKRLAEEEAKRLAEEAQSFISRAFKVFRL